MPKYKILYILGCFSVCCSSPNANKEVKNISTYRDTVVPNDSEILKPNYDFETNLNSLNSYDSTQEIIVLPEFPGGDDSLDAYIRNNIIIPKEIMGKGIIITVSLLISSKGKVIRISKFADTYGCEECKKSILELLKKFPPFTPGFVINKKNNTKESATMSIDVDFDFFRPAEINKLFYSKVFFLIKSKFNSL